MATSQSLELILKVLLSGEQDVAKLAASINNVVTATKNLPQSLPLEAGLKAVAQEAQVFAASVGKSLDIVTQKGKTAVEVFANAGKTPVDLNITGAVTKIDLLAQKTKTAVDLLSQIGKTKVDLDVTKPTAEMQAAARATAAFTNQLELLKDKSITSLAAVGDRIQQVQVRLRQLGAEKLALTINATNVDKVAAQLGLLDTNAKRVQSSIRGAGQSASGASSEFAKLSKDVVSIKDSLSDTAREALFLRRIFFGLGFSALGKEILDTVVSFDKLRAQFTAVFKEDAPAELAFITKEADRLGISVINLGDQYAKFLTAVKGTKIEGEKAKEVFLATAEAASRLSLSQEDLNGSLVALQQIASKGRLSLEELRQQLGDRLPGAVRIAAESLGLTQQKLFALIETGSIDSGTFLAGFGEALRKNFGTDANTRIETVAASLQRVKNAFTALIDSATQGQGQDAIKKVADALTKFAQDPATIQGLQTILKFFADTTGFLIENKKAVLSLIEAYAAYKVATLGLTTIARIDTLFAAIATTAPAAATGVTAVATSTSALALAAKSLVGILAIFTVSFEVTTAVLQHLDERAENAAKALGKFKTAVADGLVSAEAILRLQTLGVTMDILSNSFIKNGIELKKLTQNELIDYIDRVQEAVAANKASADLIEAQIKFNRSYATALENTADKTQAQKDQLLVLNFQYKELVDRQKSITAQTLEFGSAAAFAAARLKILTVDLKALDAVRFDQLTDAQKRLIGGFDELIAQGKSVKDALDKAIPAEFAQGGIKAIEDVAQALRALQNEGRITANQIRDGLAKELSKLTGDELLKFQANARAATLGAEALANVLRGSLSAALAKFGLDADLAGSKVSKAFADLLSSFEAVAENAEATAKQIKAALEALIISAQTKEEVDAIRAKLEQLKEAGVKFGKEIGDSFDRLEDKARLLKGQLDSALGDSFKRFGIKSREELDSIAKQAAVDFKRIADSGKATGEDLRRAFANIINQAQTFEQVEQLKKAFEDLAVSGKISAETLADGLQRIEDKLRILGGQLDSALGDSFKRLGIKARSELAGIADQAAVDFARVKNSGLANLEELKAGFAAFAASVLKATGGVLPFKVRLEAFNLDAFDVLVKGAETAADRVKKAFNAALSSATTFDQLKVLREAIVNTFEAGRISALEYKIALDQIKTATFELALQVDKEFGGALSRLGVQSKEQLRVMAEQLKEDFAQITSAGLLTTEQLRIAFEKYAAASIAANNGVADSFLTGQASALGLEAVLDKLIGKAEVFKKTIESITIPAPDAFTTDQLQQQLADFAKMLGANGTKGFVDPKVIQAILAELAKRGVAPSRNFDFLSPQPNGDPKVTQTNNFNFNQPNVTPQQVKDSVIPALQRTNLRSGVTS